MEDSNFEMVEVRCSRCNNWLLSVTQQTTGDILVPCLRCKKNKDPNYRREVNISIRNVRVVQVRGHTTAALKKAVAGEHLVALDSAT